jgi:fumarate hydratase class II
MEPGTPGLAGKIISGGEAVARFGLRHPPFTVPFPSEPTPNAMSDFRVEHDSMGYVQVPADAYYGAQTQRAVANFPISGWQLPASMISAMGLVKLACATANRDLKRLTERGKNPLTEPQVAALLQAAREVMDGKLPDQFPIDVFQTGSGTSSNMNLNEVISNRAIEIHGGDRKATDKPIHPNDHVNMGQSTNDTFPTAIHVAVGRQIDRELLPALDKLRQALAEKAAAWDKVIKIGRTHLMDATPLTLGQEISGWATQLEHGVAAVERALPGLYELALGGTAVGTGLNAPDGFAETVAKRIADLTGYPSKNLQRLKKQQKLCNQQHDGRQAQPSP